jgi:6-phosphogluconate dehydrogenase
MSSLEVGCPAPTIAQAVYARSISSFKEMRIQASSQLEGPKEAAISKADKEQTITELHDAIYCAKMCAYAQGFQLMKLAAKEHGWTLDFASIAKIWRAGCIIRAAFLQSITEAFERNEDLDNLLLDDFFVKQLNERQHNWRKAICSATMQGVPIGALSSSLAYYDSVRCQTLPANLLQGQRDFFGAHTFERADKPSGKKYHVEWSTSERETILIDG